MKKKEVCAMISGALMVIGAGAVEGDWWLLTPICLVGIAACILIGGLTKA